MTEIVALDKNFYITAQTDPCTAYVRYQLYGKDDVVEHICVYHKNNSNTLDQIIDYILQSSKLFAW